MSDDQLRRIEEALLRYAHEMHEYTLQLWTDSRKVVEEKKAVGGEGGTAAKRGRRTTAAAPELIQAKSRIVDLTLHVVQTGEKGEKADLVKAVSALSVTTPPHRQQNPIRC